MDTPQQDPQEIIREHYRRLGRMTSEAKHKAVLANIRKAQQKLSAPVAELERGYRAVKSGKTTMSRGARDVAKCSYYRFKRYVERRDAGESPKQIEGTL